MHIHECLPSGSTFHVCATLQAASRACPASAHSSSPSMPTGQAPVLEPHALNSPWLLPLTHTCWYSGLRLVMLRSVWCLFGAPGACSSNDRQRLPSRGYLISRATNPSEWFETSPACSSALPAALPCLRRGDEEGTLLQAQPAPLPWPWGELTARPPLANTHAGKNCWKNKPA